MRAYEPPTSGSTKYSFRFRILQSIVINNGPQFDNRVFKKFCYELKIKNLYSTTQYPQSNSQAEASNKTLLTALKKRLHSTKGKWVDELPRVLWAYRTTSRKPTGVSLFALTYGMEAIISTENGVLTLQTETLEKANTEAIAKDLDMTDELREVKVLRMASYQQRMANLYNMHLKSRAFRVGDLVLRRVFENMANLAAGKFQPKWERPYTIVKVGAAGSYALDKLDEMPVPRMCNAMHLKRYYQ